MTLQAQVIIIVFLFFVLAVIVNMIRQRRLELKYVLLWMGCDIALIILTCFPDLMNVLARILGIQSPMNMIFFLGFLFSLIIIFSLTVTISHFTAMVRKMAQEIALLSDELNEKTKKEE
ncbi:MAG: DUF2304 domain-containing protein [Dorea sp.]|nr:DUF2304 domain-containing protein [Dorea sp.]